MKALQYEFYSVKSIKPGGWLKKQLQIQAEGLCGNLDKFWPSIKDSAWIGGTKEDMERVPYWLDGYIPLAYLLEDTEKIAKAQSYVNQMIEKIENSEWKCDIDSTRISFRETWTTILVCKVLAFYADCSGDEERIVKVLSNCLKKFNENLNAQSVCRWGAARWFEMLIPIYWLYDRIHEDWLLDLAHKLEIQGFDWSRVIESDMFTSLNHGWDLISHVVNVAMAIKSEALMSRISEIDSESFADRFCAYLEKHNGTAYGHFNGDECLSDSSPIHGSELCSVVEAMYSYEILFSVTGNAKWLDKLEKLAYNALPASMSPDMWSHQYVQMTNQVQCAPMEKSIFRTNTSDSHIFGLEPNYGCCTANFNQGWPKFALTAFMKSKNGIAACSVAPAVLNTEVNGVAVQCECRTNYPFRSSVEYRIHTDKKTEFEFEIRIPSAAVEATVDGQAAKPGTFCKLKREWSGESTVNVCYNFETKTVQTQNNLTCLWRGPLLYSVVIEEEWQRREYTEKGVERKYPYCDYAVYPKSKWNYAFASRQFEVTEQDFTIPFTPKQPPIFIKTKMLEIPWGFENGHCNKKPDSYSCTGTEKTEAVMLIPYGCTNLRMTELPDESNHFEKD